jgi:hypothetical protein
MFVNVLLYYDNDCCNNAFTQALIPASVPLRLGTALCTHADISARHVLAASR